MSIRWKTKRPPVENETRVVTKFLLLPVCIQGDCRWMGVEGIQQVCKYFPRKEYRLPDGEGILPVIHRWENQKWVDGDEKFKPL